MEPPQFSHRLAVDVLYDRAAVHSGGALRCLIEVRSSAETQKYNNSSSSIKNRSRSRSKHQHKVSDHLEFPLRPTTVGEAAAPASAVAPVTGVSATKSKKRKNHIKFN